MKPPLKLPTTASLLVASLPGGRMGSRAAETCACCQTWRFANRTPPRSAIPMKCSTLHVTPYSARIRVMHEPAAGFCDEVRFGLHSGSDLRHACALAAVGEPAEFMERLAPTPLLTTVRRVRCYCTGTRAENSLLLSYVPALV